MRFDILTLFPDMFDGPFSSSIVARARAEGRVKIHLWNIRDFAEGRHRIVDDAPYGGGVGLVLKPEPVVAAVEAARAPALAEESLPAGAAGADPPRAGKGAETDVVGDRGGGSRTVFMTAQGAPFTQAKARELASADQLILVCGHYEGIDARAIEAVDGEELSIGDFVLTGGELPAMLVVDAVARLLPGVLGKDASSEEESFEDGLLEYPQYTRPARFRGMAVPDVLLSGDHAAVAEWRRKESLLRTLRRRPDLLARAPLTARDFALLDEWMSEAADREGGGDA